MCRVNGRPRRGRDGASRPVRVTDRVALYIRSGPAATDQMFQVDAVAGGDAEQVGRAPDHIVLELADLAIGIDQLPHHLDNAQPPLFIDLAHDDAGEMIEIDGLALDQSRGLDQLVGSAGIEPESALNQAVQLAPLDFGRLSVKRDHMDQKRGRGQLVAIVVEGAVTVGMGRYDIGNELAQSVQHRVLPQSKDLLFSARMAASPYMWRKRAPHNPECPGRCITIRQFWTRSLLRHGRALSRPSTSSQARGKAWMPGSSPGMTTEDADGSAQANEATVSRTPPSCRRCRAARRASGSA